MGIFLDKTYPLRLQTAWTLPIYAACNGGCHSDFAQSTDLKQHEGTGENPDAKHEVYSKVPLHSQLQELESSVVDIVRINPDPANFAHVALTTIQEAVQQSTTP
jgi:hypothetical protein